MAGWNWFSQNWCELFSVCCPSNRRCKAWIPSEPMVPNSQTLGLTLRLFGQEDYLTEVGTMNLFVAWTNEDGVKELVTAPLDGTILDGVTRDSVLDLARERLASEGWNTLEQKITMPQVRQAAKEGRLHEVFGAGTAAIVAPVKTIHYE